MGLESSNSRMANLARQEMYFHQFFTAEEVIVRIEAVTAEQIQAMAQRLFVSDRIAVTLLGRLDRHQAQPRPPGVLKSNRQLLAFSH